MIGSWKKSKRGAPAPRLDDVAGGAWAIVDGCALVADGLDTTGTDIFGALGDTLKSTYKQREAGYNLAFVEDDKSHGVHNPEYCIQLLQQSYNHLTGTDVPNAKILREEKAVSMDW